MAKLTLPDGAVYETAPGEATKAEWDGETTYQSVIKSVDEQRYTLSVGYAANLADAAKARDGHKDFATAETIEKAAWDYIAHPEVGLFHEDGTEGAGRCVESYIYRGPDWPVDGSVIKSGDWLIGIQWDEPTWQEIKAGRINGTSMQGRTQRRTPSPADVARVVARRG
jgi:hypothetical protein